MVHRFLWLQPQIVWHRTGADLRIFEQTRCLFVYTEGERMGERKSTLSVTASSHIKTLCAVFVFAIFVVVYFATETCVITMAHLHCAFVFKEQHWQNTRLQHAGQSITNQNISLYKASAHRTTNTCTRDKKNLIRHNFILNKTNRFFRFPTQHTDCCFFRFLPLVPWVPLFWKSCYPRVLVCHLFSRNKTKKRCFFISNCLCVICTKICSVHAQNQEQKLLLVATVAAASNSTDFPNRDDDVFSLAQFYTLENILLFVTACGKWIEYSHIFRGRNRAIWFGLPQYWFRSLTKTVIKYYCSVLRTL